MTTPTRIRWGLLGTGNICRKLLAGARLASGLDVVAVGSRTDERARQFARDNGIGRAHGSYEALLADPDVDAVYISLPNSLHHEWTMHSLAAGKHVLCEKPYTPPAGGGRRGVRCGRAGGPGARGGVHVAPHAPGAPPPGAAAPHRSGTHHPVHLQLRHRGRDRCPGRGSPRWWLAHGCRLLLRERREARRRRAGAGHGGAARWMRPASSVGCPG